MALQDSVSLAKWDSTSPQMRTISCIAMIVPEAGTRIRGLKPAANHAVLASTPRPQCLRHVQVVPAGYYQGAERQTGCHACPAGKYQTQIMALHAISAQVAGISRVVESQSALHAQLASTGVGSATRTSCTKCPSGQYQNVAGSASCTSCSKGKYNDVVAAKTANDCKSCPAGRYGTETGRTSASQCTLCVAGKFSESSSSGITSCSLCPDGFASATSGAASQGTCAACPQGKTSSINRDSCTDCPQGKFRSGLSCLSCGTCTNGKQLRTQANLKCGGSDGGSCVTCPMGYFSPESKLTPMMIPAHSVQMDGAVIQTSTKAKNAMNVPCPQPA